MCKAGLRREGILPSLRTARCAEREVAKAGRLTAPGKAECLPSENRPIAKSDRLLASYARSLRVEDDACAGVERTLSPLREAPPPKSEALFDSPARGE